MFAQQDDIDTLAARVRDGDREAEALLHRQLEPAMVHLVRRTLCGGNNTNALSKWILAETRPFARAVRQPGPDAAERLLGQVVRRMCDLVVDGLAHAANPRQWLKDTVACA